MPDRPADRSADQSTRRAPARPRWVRWLRAFALLVAVTGVVGSPWWGPRALARLDFFHVRRVEFEGVRYARAAELVALLDVDTLQSVWQPLEPLSQRVAKHALVTSAEVTRRLPSTLVVRVLEREPVALVQVRGRLQPTDGSGHALPIDPARVALDVPIASSADSTLMHLLDGLRQSEPTLYGRVTSAARAGQAELQFVLGDITIRTTPDVTVARFKDILPVETDLARNGLRAVELDLRFRDQVIARQP
ncbi:MAG TPA: FtsQ-type POTRA domain-containing protein [Gemmatimonas sp.]|uniref:cell division protein FtsQ/DivIB n=1 Tax=Gemmatimonas sp. TaxID=1962908 RepID=UPI002EDA18AC